MKRWGNKTQNHLPNLKVKNSLSLKKDMLKMLLNEKIVYSERNQIIANAIHTPWELHFTAVFLWWKQSIINHTFSLECRVAVKGNAVFRLNSSTGSQITIQHSLPWYMIIFKCHEFLFDLVLKALFKKILWYLRIHEWVNNWLQYISVFHSLSPQFQWKVSWLGPTNTPMHIYNTSVCFVVSMHSFFPEWNIVFVYSIFTQYLL